MENVVFVENEACTNLQPNSQNIALDNKVIAPSTCKVESSAHEKSIITENQVMENEMNVNVQSVPQKTTDVIASCSCRNETLSKTINTENKGKESTANTNVPASNGPSKPRIREEKSRKKDDKSVEVFLKTLNSLNSTDEKLAAYCKKYTDLFDEHRKLQIVAKQTEKKCATLQKEKEQLQAEHNRTILTRSRLENLCRELQRQNKAIKDENLLKIREEEEKRKEVSAKFQNTLTEITTLMQQNSDKNMKLRDDNIDIAAKLKNVCEQYELREQQMDKIAKQMELETQLADAKMAKLQMERAADKEMFLREKHQILLELNQAQERCQQAQEVETSLRCQISVYNDKYDDFQKALEKSNNVFAGFKGEMEKMSKKICKLEKETSSWKQRWERSHGAQMELTADKQRTEQKLAVASRQLGALQDLCRTLQNERTQLLAKIKVLESTPAQVVEPVKNAPSNAFDVASKNDVLEEKTNSGNECLKNILTITDCGKENVITDVCKNETPIKTDVPSNIDCTNNGETIKGLSSDDSFVKDTSAKDNVPIVDVSKEETTINVNVLVDVSSKEVLTTDNVPIKDISVNETNVLLTDHVPKEEVIVDIVKVVNSPDKCEGVVPKAENINLLNEQNSQSSVVSPKESKVVNMINFNEMFETETKTKTEDKIPDCEFMNKDTSSGLEPLKPNPTSESPESNKQKESSKKKKK
uniref:Alpha-taxilin n=1 Tax=Clastoptera arizonana TaxID=38151 RepID=A0A1B6D608_9HEMI